MKQSVENTPATVESKPAKQTTSEVIESEVGIILQLVGDNVHPAEIESAVETARETILAVAGFDPDLPRESRCPYESREQRKEWLKARDSARKIEDKFKAALFKHGALSNPSFRLRYTVRGPVVTQSQKASLAVSYKPRKGF